jgi:uncharacterized protein
MIASRLQALPCQEMFGFTFPVATSRRSRMLGLALLERKEAGEGLLIPRCASVHTFGMRFPLDLVFIDREGRPLAVRFAVPSRRIVWQRGAEAVLEIPSPEGGRVSRRQGLRSACCPKEMRSPTWLSARTTK